MRPLLILALVTALTLGTAACGDEDTDTPAASPAAAPSPTTPAATGSATPTGSGTESPPASRSAPDRSGTPTRGGPPEVTDTIATGLDAPWDIAFLPDGTALVSERDSASIKRIGTGPDHEVTTVGTVGAAAPGGEGGLLGLAIPPDFSRDPRIYAYVTAAQDNRILRFPFQGGDLGEPEVILDGLAKSTIHNGGRMVFGPDGMLYVGTGDASRRDLAQDPDSRNGKILRITPDGEPAPGNPTEGSAVYTSGHRNVQGLAFDDRGRLWASEFGQDRFDELNLIRAGANYGWPEVEGIGEKEGFQNPQRVWETDDASPSGIAFADGSIWMASLRGQRLWQIPLTDRTEGSGEAPLTREPQARFTDEYGRLRDVELAPDGSLWVMTNNTDGRGEARRGDDRILRVAVAGGR